MNMDACHKKHYHLSNNAGCITCSYGGALLPGEGSAIAQYVQSVSLRPVFDRIF
jgi:hypothetical protein